MIMPDEILNEEQADNEFATAFAEGDDQSSGAPADPASGDEKHGDDAFDEAPEKTGTQDTEQSAEQNVGSTVDKDELQRKAHGYDSMLGRLQAEQRRRQELEERLAKLEQPEQQKAPTTIEVPADLKTEIEELTNRDPQLAAIVLEDSKDGEKLRKSLEEYGVDYAEERADTIRLRREVRQKVSSVEATTQSAMRDAKADAFYSAVSVKHPDWVSVTTDPARRQDYDAYMANVRSWAESLPYAEGAAAFRVMEKGTPAEVVDLLDRYKAAKQGGGTDRKGPSADDALAVPSRSGPPPSRKIASKDDFDSAFDEAPEE
jgi:hypothetical protein